MWQHMFSMPVMRTVWRRELDSLKTKIDVNCIYRLNPYRAVNTLLLGYKTSQLKLYKEKLPF